MTPTTAVLLISLALLLYVMWGIKRAGGAQAIYRDFFCDVELVPGDTLSIAAIKTSTYCTVWAGVAWRELVMHQCPDKEFSMSAYTGETCEFCYEVVE